MSRIIKGEAELDDVDKIYKLNFYNHIVYFKALRLELLFWEKNLDSLKIKNPSKIILFIQFLSCSMKIILQKIFLKWNIL